MTLVFLKRAALTHGYRPITETKAFTEHWAHCHQAQQWVFYLRLLSEGGFETEIGKNWSCCLICVLKNNKSVLGLFRWMARLLFQKPTFAPHSLFFTKDDALQWDPKQESSWEWTNRKEEILITPSSQKCTERRNYPMEVNELSQVDEGKIAVKRGQSFLFSLSLFRGKWLRSRSILLEDAEHSNTEME